MRGSEGICLRAFAIVQNDLRLGIDHLQPIPISLVTQILVECGPLPAVRLEPMGPSLGGVTDFASGGVKDVLH